MAGDKRKSGYRTVWPFCALCRCWTQMGGNWILNALYHAQADARRDGRDGAAAEWRKAAAEHRIKVRKVRGQDKAKVTLISG